MCWFAIASKRSTFSSTSWIAPNASSLSKPLSVLPALRSYTASRKAAICCRKIFVNAACATAPARSISPQRVTSLDCMVLAGVTRKNEPAIVSSSKLNRPPHLPGREKSSFVYPYDFSPSHILQQRRYP